jgi:MoaA/NifB/PqqE/SkfB family radical SAM enzyme
MRSRDRYFGNWRQSMAMPKIRLFHIEVSNTCNFRCAFCPVTVTRRKPLSMPLSVFKKIIDQVSENRLSTHIMLHVLGEPLLYADIIGAVRYASDRQLKVIVTTNGSLLNEDIIKTLNDSGLYSMDISLQLLGTNRHISRHAGLQFDDYYRRIVQSIRIIR